MDKDYSNVKENLKAKVDSLMNKCCEFVAVLMNLLDHNVFDSLHLWKFHYDEYLPWVERHLVDLFVLSTSIPNKTHTDRRYMSASHMTHLNNWMRHRLLHYDPSYCFNNDLLELGIVYGEERLTLT